MRVGEDCSRTVLHLHRGTPYVYQGEELGMTNAPLRRRIERLPRHRVAQPLRRGASARGRRPGRRCSRALRRDEPRQRPHADAVGRRAGTPASPPARRGSPVNPNHAEINAAAARRRPGLGLPPLPAADRAAAHASRSSPHGDFTMLLPDDDELYAFTRPLDGSQLLVLANFSSTTIDVSAVIDHVGRRGAGARQLPRCRQRARAPAVGGSGPPALTPRVLDVESSAFA